MRAMRLLSGAADDASLAHDVAAVGVADAVVVMMDSSGRELTRVRDASVPPGVPPQPDQVIRNLTRPALQRALYAALPPGTVVCGAAFAAAKPLPDGRVEVRFEAAAGEAPPEAAVVDVLVGADGIRSSVRSQLEKMGAPPRRPVYSGYRYYRGLVDLEKLGGADAWVASLGGTNNRIIYGASETCMLYQVSPTHASFARYCPAPEGSSRGVSPAEAKQHLMELCKGYPYPAPQMAEALEGGAIHLGELWSMPPSEEVWGAGCITLAGDAAHAVLPTLGQGAGQGVEDAVTLAITLHRAAASKAAAASGGGGAANAACRLSPAEVEAALRQYEAERGPHVQRVYHFSTSAFRSGVGESWLGRLRRNWQYRLMPAWLMKKATAWLTECTFAWDEAPPAAAAVAATA
ncbi:zeaxanthin epoxidase isoform A [Micractinium conductrix]|uniref:Zeaxanthin epoxidase isoform A n=1 Tax=Micractinium conductrix TaxID=554055 RepID=A0A2P6V3R7_9CHLO|nr:zeaxanthin epoxidase isoform A [Micractinium conductrix]|eukprot:PSC68728.1 zeaxanthin epoxidase isoform A [Micractinium conductrix]